jgi:hypothetical protein
VPPECRSSTEGAMISTPVIAPSAAACGQYEPRWWRRPGTREREAPFAAHGVARPSITNLGPCRVR